MKKLDKIDLLALLLVILPACIILGTFLLDVVLSVFGVI